MCSTIPLAVHNPRRIRNLTPTAPSPAEVVEFILICPHTKERIHGKLTVLHLNDRQKKASVCLHSYVDSLCRNPVTQEEVVNRVLDKLLDVYHPGEAKVRGDFDPGEGLRISIEAVYKISVRFSRYAGRTNLDVVAPSGKARSSVTAYGNIGRVKGSLLCAALSTNNLQNMTGFSADGTRQTRNWSEIESRHKSSRNFYRAGSRVNVPTLTPVLAGVGELWIVQTFCAPGPTYMLKFGPPVIDSVPVQSGATV